MSATLTPRQRAYKVVLEEARAITEDDMRAAVERLPAHIRSRLAEGPRQRRWSCGVCDAFGADWYTTTTFDLADPTSIAYLYHEVPKADMKHRDQLHYGDFANEIYTRAIATYRAAGWTGDAEEPNA